MVHSNAVFRVLMSSLVLCGIVAGFSGAIPALSLSIDQDDPVIVIANSDGTVFRKVPLSELKKIYFREHNSVSSGGNAPRQPLFDLLVVETRDGASQEFGRSSELIITKEEKTANPEKKPTTPQVQPVGRPPKDVEQRAAGSDSLGPDNLGRVWQIQEGEWRGTWTRQGDSNEFVGVWHLPAGKVVKDVLVLESLKGDRLVVFRKGQNARYQCQISPDRKKIFNGTNPWFPSGILSGTIEGK